MDDRVVYAPIGHMLIRIIGQMLVILISGQKLDSTNWIDVGQKDWTDIGCIEIGQVLNRRLNRCWMKDYILDKS